MKPEALRLARIVWDYHHLNQEPLPAEVIIALGTNDLRVAEFAADLYHRGFGRKLVCTGGLAHQQDLLATNWTRTEAEMYAEVALGRGVAREDILLETRATNTSENLRFSRELLGRKGFEPNRILIVVKPFMQRRAWATLVVEWPQVQATLASPNLTLEQYFTNELTPERIIHILVGDLQRTWVYAERGYSAPQVIPDEVKRAYDALLAMGFTKHLL